MLCCSLQAVYDAVTSMTFVADMERALKLLQPILAVFQSLEVDKPLLSQCLHVWLSVFKHVYAWADAEYQPVATLEAKLLKRFKKCYHPSMCAAYLADPAFYVPETDCDNSFYAVNSSALKEFERYFKIDFWKDAKEVSP